MRMHKIAYVAFIASKLSDLVTTFFCLQVDGLVETNPLYQVIGVWAFPAVLLIDAGILLSVELLRKRTKWSPLLLLSAILIYTKACVTNLQLLCGMY